MRELFAMIEATKEEYDTHIELSMVEIYNELIRDLLSDDFPYCPRGGLKLLENEKERVTLDGVTLKTPKSVEDVMELVLLGNQRRSTSFTESNSESSRSHAVLQINVRRSNKSTEVDHDQEVVQRNISGATLSIIDLAGSERASATRNMGARMKEGANINKSLLALSSCISALCATPVRGSRPHVPYRNSKLTRMLKFSLGGNCRTVMIVCVSPSSRDIEDTHNTLVWADKAKNVSTKISRNTSGQHISVKQYLVTIDQQSQKIRLLEAKLAEANEGKGSDQTYARQKLLSARKEAQGVIQSARTELLAALPTISEGATQRALWDGAEMRIAALTRVIEELDSNATGLSAEDLAREKAFIDSLVQQQSSDYRQNRTVQDAVQREADATVAVDRIFKSAEERTFGDVLEPHDLEWFRQGVTAHRLELDRKVAAAREKGYRDMAQTQAEAFAQLAGLMFRLNATVEEETDLLSGIAQTDSLAEDFQISVERLRSTSKDTFAQLASLFSRTTLAAPPPLPALPQPRSLEQILSPPRQSAQPVTRFLGQPQRSKNATSAKQSAAAFHANPAARRLLSKTAPKSPGRPARSVAGTPLKSALRRAPFRVGHVKGRTPKKSARWNDEAGGPLDDRSTALDAAVFSSDTSGQVDDEWAEEDSGATGSPPSVSKPVFALSAPRTTIPQPAFTLSKARSSLSSSGAIPEWKKNRIMLGKTTSELPTLGEESESKPSPDKPLSQLGLGKPARPYRGPLAERQHNTPSPTSSGSAPSSGGGMSNLLRPTLASLNKANDTTSSKMGPPARRVSSIGSQKAVRRVSSVGPYSTANMRKPRASVALGDTSIQSSASGVSPAGAADTSIGLGSGLNLGPSSKRMFMQPTSLSPTIEASRRGSLLPRASMASLPRINPGTSLAPRPSIPNFRQSVGTAGGDTSATMRPWR